MYLPDCFMVEKSSGITAIEDLDGKVLGLTRGSVGEATTMNMIDNGVFTPADIRTYDTFESPVQEIVNGRIDAGYWDVVGFQYGAQENPDTFANIDCIPITPEQMGEEEVLPVYYLFPKGEDRMLEEVNTIIADMVADGTIAEIFSHFGLTDPHLVTGFGSD
jgi:ABC-type amino acid transport substrate-binding protein